MELIPNLTQKQKAFIELFSALFNIRDAHGNQKPFVPELFQQEFLADSILCNPNYPNRIVNKGRGVGLTALVAGELVIAATAMKKIKIPITSISAKTANVLVDWCIELTDSSNDLSTDTHKYTRIKRDERISSIVKFTNGSQIIPISGGSPESIRSLRAPILVLDEFAFNEYQREILTAGERCVSEGGQITIISTPRTTDVINDEFWRIWIKADDLQYKRYEFPIFPRDKVDVNRSLLEQNLTPIAPWIDMETLERDRRRDALMFSRENLCLPMDESVAFLAWQLIVQSCILPYTRKGILNTENDPIFCGVDVGREQDLTVIEVFQKNDNVYNQIDEIIMKGRPIPDQVKRIGKLHEQYNFEVVNVDKTGIGLGLYDYCRKEIGGRVKGIHFNRDIKTNIATNMRNLMQDGKMYFFKYDDIMDDLHSVPYDTLDAPRDKNGHADRFWACCLAVMKPKSRIINAGNMLDSFI